MTKIMPLQQKKDRYHLDTCPFFDMKLLLSCVLLCYILTCIEILIRQS